MSIDELLLYIRAYRLLLISERELWPDPFITQGIKRALRRHRKGLKILIAWCSIDTCPARDLHRRYWRYREGRFECEVCRRIAV